MNARDNRLLKRSLYALFAGALIALQGIPLVAAKDTDVYLMSPTVARDDAPNVMIVLDNSGSMDTIISATQIGYDPSINYCTDDLDVRTGIVGANAGKPSNCASISGRIYWAFNVPGKLLTPPDMNSNDWFSSSKNYCLDSTSAFNSAGYYGATRIAQWRSGYGWRTLKNKSNSTITYVDCERDNDSTGTIDGQAAADNKYPRSSTSTAYATSGSAFVWGNFNTDATPTLYNANYMNYWNNPNLVDELSRLDVAKSTVKSVIDANPSIRFGLTVFNYNNLTPDGGRVVMRIDTMDDARRTAMKNIVDSLTASTWTPLAETMWEVYKYFSGTTVTYGNPSPDQTPHQDSCAQNVTNSACNKGGVYDAIAAGNSAYNTGTYISPFKYGCQTAYIIYVTDGDPTNDSSANTSITSKIGTSCDGSSCLDDLAGYMHNNDVYLGLPGKQAVNTYTIGFGGGISPAGLALLKEAAETDGGGKYYTADNTAQLATALQGALTDILSVTSSFVAPSLSINAFNKLYDRDDVYFALFKPSSSVGWNGNIKRYKLCNTTDPGCTFGEIIDFNGDSAIDTTTSKITNSAVSYWSLDTSVPDGPDVTKGGAGAIISQNSVVPRTLYTYRGSYTGLSVSAPAIPVAVEATSGNTLYDTAINDPTILGLPDTSGSATTTNTADTDAVTQLINWMRGQDAFDVRVDSGSDTGHTGNTTEARSWNFSDPLHSRPVAITYGCVGSGPCNSSSTPIVKLFVGNNDGTIRILNADSGAEEWAFVPSEMLSSQYPLAQNADGDHIYGIDDTASFWINDINSDGVIDPAAGDFVYMYIGMRRGGRNIYAFDVTPPAKLTTQTQADPDKIKPKLMWVIKGGTGNFAQLGQTWSRPKVARIRFTCSGSECDDGNPNTNDSSSRMVLIFGGGYDTNQDNGIPAGTDVMGNAIYIVDPKTGTRLWWASSDTGASKVLAKMQYSIPSELTLMDSNGDKYIDRIYIGDTGGQLWRIDLAADMSDTSNGATDAYVFADVGCDSTSTTRRIHDSAGACPTGTTLQGRRKFFYPPDVTQVDDPSYSTTAYYDMVTIATGDREDPLDLLTSNMTPVEEAVHNRIYAFRDYNYKPGPPAVTPSATTETEMYDASANQLGTLTGSSLTDEINNKVKSSQGWFIDLKEASSITLTNGLTTSWVGEKSLARTVIYAGVIYVTTFVPANDSTAQNTCQANEGEGRYYALNYLNATPVYDLNNDGAIERSTVVGGGIPSEVIVVIRDSGVTGLVGVSGGATQTKVKDKVTIFKTYWYEE